ncbi:MAG: ATP-binding protein, partial [Candidatus Natronoplasma sp.]
VLTGSSIGMMHNVAIDGRAPLYGRISKEPNGKFDIGPLPFKDAMKFFPGYDPEEQVMAFGVFGGTPEYLRAIDPSRSLKENVTRTLLDRNGGLHEEPEDVLHRELEEVDRYFAVLKAMAEGNRKTNEIGQASGIKSGSEGYYLDRLRKLRIIERSYPVTVDPARSRQGRYRIRDPLFRFWFRFVYGRSTRYEVYGGDAYKDLIEPELPHFVSSTFEELCQRALLQIYQYNFTEMPGNWWDSDGHEIDIVAPTSEEKLVVGEVKFQQKPLDYSVLAQLEREASLVHWKPPKGNEPEYEYVLFSRSGFSSSVKETAEEREDIRTFTVDDVVSLLSKKAP